MKTRRLFAIVLIGSIIGAFLPPIGAQKKEPAKKQAAPVVHFKGRVAPPPAVLAAMKAAAFKRHGYVARRVPKVTSPTWDCRLLSLVPPIKNQASCGSCWNFSGTGTANSAMIKAQFGKFDSFTLSEQYTMDCYSNGGCNGDDNTTVLAHAKNVGLPLESDYGPYTASSGRCKSGSVTLYKLADWGFCSPNNNGVSDTQDVKNMMVAYGPIGCAVAAGGSDFWNSGQGTCTGHSTSIDHDVILIGWDDNHDNGDGSKGAWIMRNSWGASWGNGGYAWMKYGADSIGTESVWAAATPVVPPAPVPPVPPGPTPPVPPVPPAPGAPVITSPLTAVAKLGKAFSYQIEASNNPTILDVAELPTGWTCAPGGLVNGTLNSSPLSLTLVAANSAGASSAVLVVTATAVPAIITLTPEQVQTVLDAQTTAGEPPLADPFKTKKPTKKRKVMR